LSACLALAGCAGQYPQPAGYNSNLPSLLGNQPGGQPGPPATGIGKTGGPVALLVPLTGDLAPAGQALVNAAKLAFSATGAPALDIRDTGGNPAGAVTAAQAAIAAGDGLILGPLTSAETHAVAPIAQAAGVNVLAFTNDSSAATPGVWTMGITPEEQVTRIVSAASAAGRTQLAALLPDSDFGHSLGTALQTATAALSEPSPNLTFYEDGFSNLNQSIRDLSDFQDRGAGLEAQIKAAKDEDTPAGNEKARELEHQQIAPPAFNALFIGATQADELAEIATLLPFYSVTSPQVQFLGPALWANIAPAMGSNGVYNGALYAAPDPATAAPFDQKYQSAYGGAPPAIADVGFDSAAIAVLAASQGGYTSGVLTQPSGFSGLDGVLQLEPSGQVQRGLAVFQIQPGAPSIASPAPTSFTAPSS
jgi:ABC-type branched-subunit amino acid transport system substrate-binding protein